MNDRVVCIEFFTKDDRIISEVSYVGADYEVDEERAILVVEHERKHRCDYGIIHFENGNVRIHQN
jgi:hypothetical protein